MATTLLPNQLNFNQLDIVRRKLKKIISRLPYVNYQGKRLHSLDNDNTRINGVELWRVVRVIEYGEILGIIQDSSGDLYLVMNHFDDYYLDVTLNLAELSIDSVEFEVVE